MTSLSLTPLTHRVLMLLIFLFIPISVMAPQALVWEIIIGGLIGFYYTHKQSLLKFPKPLIFILLVIPLWGLVTTLWAYNPFSTALVSLKVLSLGVLGAYWCRFTLSMSPSTQAYLIKAFVAGLILGMVLLAINKLAGNFWQTYLMKSSSKAFAQGSLMISLAAWISILWAFQQPYSLLLRIGLVGFFLISIFWTLFQIDCDTSFMGLFLGICAFGGTMLLPRLTSWGMRLLVPILIVSFPFVSYYAFKPELIPTYNTFIHSPSYIDRLYIWNDVATTIFKNPWQGIGMGGTPHHENRHLKRHWTFTDRNGKTQDFQTSRFGMHPHNAILQLWLELGIFGLLLGTLLAHFVLSQIFRTSLDRMGQAICAGLFSSAFLIVWVNLGFWQTWWISGLWMIIGLSITIFKNKREIDERALS